MKAEGRGPDGSSKRLDRLRGRWAIRWSAIEVEQPQDGRVMAVNYIFDENDGEGRSCWIGPAQGIAEAKKPDLYREFVLIR